MRDKPPPHPLPSAMLDRDVRHQASRHEIIWSMIQQNILTTDQARAQLIAWWVTEGCWW